MSDQVDQVALDRVNEIIETDVIKLAGLEGMSEEKKAEFRTTATKTIFRRALTRVLNTLTDKGLAAEYAKLENDEERCVSFMKQYGIDFDQILIEESVLYKTEIKVMSEMLDTAAKDNSTKNEGQS